MVVTPELHRNTPEVQLTKEKTGENSGISFLTTTKHLNNGNFVPFISTSR